MASARYEAEVRVTSARGLKNVNWRHGPLRPYAVVWVDPDRKVTTRVDEERDEEPVWDQTLSVPFDEPPPEDAVLRVDVVHAYAEPDTKPLIGSARLPLRDVLDEAGLAGRPVPRDLKLKRPSGRPQGKVDLEVAVRDLRYRGAPPPPPPAYGVRDPYGGQYAPPAPYGAPPPSYAAPPAGYPYGQPSYGQPAGYGYGQPEYGYGQAQAGVVVEEKKKSKFGGMGTGLAVGAVAGALGGLALAEGFDKLEDHIADEAAERVEDDLAAGDDFGGDDDDGW